MVDKLLKSTLDTLGVPVKRLVFRGAADTYITFQHLLSQDGAFADDEAAGCEHMYRVDIFSKTDYTGLLKRLKQAVKDAGFYAVSVNAEIYENDTGYYHIPMDMKYWEE